MAEKEDPQTITGGEDQVNSLKHKSKDGTCSMQINITNAQNVMAEGGTMKVYMSHKPKRPKSQRKSKKPLTTVQEPVTRDQILELKGSIGDSAMDLGRRLGFADGELQQLHVQYVHDLSEFNYQILWKWTQREAGNATQAALAKVFMKLNRGDLADMLVTFPPQLDFEYE